MSNEKSTVVAYILWCAGIFGVHKFYLRQPLMGIIYLFTAGLFFIGWIIDLFTLPDQVAAFNDQLYIEEGYLEEDLTLMEDRIDELEEEVDYLREKLKATEPSSSAPG